MRLYTPHLMRIEESRMETPDVKTLRLRFLDPEAAERFQFRAGQFGLYSVFGEGESTFCIASPPTRSGYIECTFRALGKVTDVLRKKEVGDTIGFRGPYGNSFPMESFAGKDLLFVIGGIALPPLRCVIWNALDLRDRYGKVRIVYGARTVADLVYKDELKEWESAATSSWSPRSIPAARRPIGREGSASCRRSSTRWRRRRPTRSPSSADRRS